MRRVRVLVGLAAAVVAATLPTGGAAAPTQNHVSIETNAQWWDGHVEVQVHVACENGGFPASVEVQAFQSPPENFAPTQGFGASGVTCDGQQRQAAVHVVPAGAPFDVGKAFAVATVSTQFGTATDSKTINITF